MNKLELCPSNSRCLLNANSARKFDHQHKNMPPKDLKVSEKRLATAKRRAQTIRQSDPPKFGARIVPSLPVTPRSHETSPCPVDQPSSSTTEVANDIPVLDLPVVKQERPEDRSKTRGKNWTDKEIPLLVQAGLGVNMDARHGSDNRLRYGT